MPSMMDAPVVPFNAPMVRLTLICRSLVPLMVTVADGDPSPEALFNTTVPPVMVMPLDALEPLKVNNPPPTVTPPVKVLF